MKLFFSLKYIIILNTSHRKIEINYFLAQTRSASVKASSLSSQVKAAVAQVNDRNWNWEEKILCLTTMQVRSFRRLALDSIDKALSN